MTLLKIITKLETAFPQISWNLPPDLNFGILTTNYAFVEGKKTGVNPVEFAMQVVEKLSLFVTEQKLPVKLETKGPYMNLDLTLEGWREAMEYIDDIDFEKKKETVLLDYFNCNVGKKIHIGHIRSGDIGECLRRVLSLSKSKIITAPYLGDWGIQFSYLIWGLENFEKLDLEFSKPDLESADKIDLINKFYAVYVKVNALLVDQLEIKKDCQQLQASLEKILNGKLESDKLEFSGKNFDIRHYWQKIIEISVSEYKQTENYLNLNKGGFTTNLELFNPEITKQILATGLCWQLNKIHQEGQFDLIIGESFYIPFTPEFDYLVEKGLAIKEDKAIYMDLENEKLGRSYLISSEGYSLYHTRDIVARFVWSGLLQVDTMLSLADNRQNHSFKQVFAVLKRILDSGIYEENHPNNTTNRTFGWLNREQTNRAILALKTKMAELVSFGFMTLPEGAMSTRKGKIIAFEDLKSTLETRVTEVLSQKESQATDPDLVQKVSVATLKWVDLHRDRDQDVVFDFDQFLKFEGNTGVYQLYTYARVNSILEKNKPENKNAFENIVEKILELKKTKSRIVVAIEGRPGSGKSTLAKKLGKLLTATVVKVDDFYLPKKDRTEDTLKTTFNYDLERLQNEVIQPFLNGVGSVKYLKYNWGDWAGVEFDGLSEVREYKFENILIIEGCATLNPKLEEAVDLKIWVEKENESAENRALRRDINYYGLPKELVLPNTEIWGDNYVKYLENFKPQEITDFNVLAQDLEIDFESFKLLNNDELGILKLMYTLPLIIEDVSSNYKPHHLCNYLFKLATSVNSWYAKYSVTSEQNSGRKEVLLDLLSKVKKNMEFGLSLLGIEVVEKL
ncbi:MAG: arginine--tRNA ligase [bacterium]